MNTKFIMFYHTGLNWLEPRKLKNMEVGRWRIITEMWMAKRPKLSSEKGQPGEKQQRRSKMFKTNKLSSLLQTRGCFDNYSEPTNRVYFISPKPMPSNRHLLGSIFQSFNKVLVSFVLEISAVYLDHSSELRDTRDILLCIFRNMKVD